MQEKAFQDSLEERRQLAEAGWYQGMLKRLQAQGDEAFQEAIGQYSRDLDQKMHRRRQEMELQLLSEKQRAVVRFNQSHMEEGLLSIDATGT